MEVEHNRQAIRKQLDLYQVAKNTRKGATRVISAIVLIAIYAVTITIITAHLSN